MAFSIKQVANKVENMSCEERCLAIIASNSPMFKKNPNKFSTEVVKSGANLGKVLISSPKADRQVRPMINTATGSKHSPGSFSATTTIATILRDSCISSGRA